MTSPQSIHHLVKRSMYMERSIKQKTQVSFNGFQKQIQQYQIAYNFEAYQIWYAFYAQKILKEAYPLVPSLQLSYKSKIEVGKQKLVSLLSVNSKEILTCETFMALLSSFSYLWSQESIDSYIEFLNSLPDPLYIKATHILITHPQVFSYFESALTATFFVLEIKSNQDFVDLLLQELKNYTALIPDFFRKILSHNSTTVKVFWNMILRPIIDHFTLFGIRHPEVSLEYQPKIKEIIELLDNFFGKDEALSYIQSLYESEKDHMLTELPSISQIMSVYPSFCNISLVPPQASDVFEIPPNPAFIPISFGTNSKESSSPTKSEQETEYDSVFPYILNFLDLIEPYPISIENLFDYFKKALDLTPPSENRLEAVKILQQIYSILDDHPLSTEDIYNGILSLLNEKEANVFHLDSLGDYSHQFDLIHSLIAKNDLMAKNIRLYFEFKSSEQFVNAYEKTNPPPEEISNQTFISYFSSLAEAYSVGVDSVPTSIFRNLMIVLLFKQGILQKYEAEPENVLEDQKLNTFIAENSENLIKSDFEGLETISKDMPSMQMFIKEFTAGFQSNFIFERIFQIFKGKQILESLLIIQGANEFGADQLVPLTKIATVFSNPLKLKTTAHFLKDYIIDPFGNKYSPLENDELYFMTQFMASIKILENQLTLNQ